jgi:transcriptional regulator with XRE-family HTH domain
MDKTHKVSSFGHWLSRQRKARDLTQEDLAERIGCSLWTIQKIEAGSRQPSKQVAELLADILGITPESRTAFVQFARGRANIGNVENDWEEWQEAGSYQDQA